MSWSYLRPAATRLETVASCRVRVCGVRWRRDTSSKPNCTAFDYRERKCAEIIINYTIFFTYSGINIQNHHANLEADVRRSTILGPGAGQNSGEGAKVPRGRDHGRVYVRLQIGVGRAARDDGAR